MPSSATPAVLPHSRRPATGSVVVVGAGLAGAQTVAALRSHGFSGRVTILGAEGVGPYDRPALSKELFTRQRPAWLVEEMGVDVVALADEARLDDPAVDLDPGTDAVTITTRSGRRVTADVAVLALGAEPVRPAGWEAALTLHTADDAARLRERLVPGTRLVSIGAGWIGAELAGVASKAGCEVTVLEAAQTPLERQLGAEVGGHLVRWYAEAGARLLTGTQVTEVGPTSVRLADGRSVEGDLVLAAVGARPATAWLKGTLPLDPRGSIRVNSAGRVAPPTVAAPSGTSGHLPLKSLRRLYAVGDCATRDSAVFGPVPGGHWSAALHDPEPTVRALLGIDEMPAEPQHVRELLGLAPVPQHAPYVFSQQLGHDIALFGTPSPFHEVVYRGDPSGGASGHEGWVALYLETVAGAHRTNAEGHRLATVRAILVVDAPREVGPVRKLMNRDVALHVDVEAATDPSRRLRDAVV
ncbi:NAD(P)/FAD-dependent oxidoreductase [Oerskovia douganii]|uniref:NAD(P)/FAD-dependent oxidoreductase n=1 Tax=Oerskovia douganii TaxID=2762210 RepID=UPI002AB22D9E|nr:FAD-dependent oxidoreductase [Oerskovia douganii]